MEYVVTNHSSIKSASTMMKSTVLIVLVCAAALEAHPGLGLGGIGNAIGDSLARGVGGLFGTGAGLLGGGAHALATGALGLGSGLVNGILPGAVGGVGSGLGMAGRLTGGSGYNSGGGYSGQKFDNGASGGYQGGSYASGGNHAQNAGQHHHKVTSITQAEDSGSHNINSGQGYSQGQQGSGQYSGQQSGLSNQGNQYNRGYQNQGLY